MSLKWPPLTFRVITLQDNIRLWFDRKIDESALNKVQNVKEYHFNPYLLFSEKGKVWECFELCNYVNGNCRILNMANICQHNNHSKPKRNTHMMWFTKVTHYMTQWLKWRDKCFDKIDKMLVIKWNNWYRSYSNRCSQEPMSRSLQLPYEAYVTAFLQPDLFSVHLFFCERKAVPGQWRSDVN